MKLEVWQISVKMLHPQNPPKSENSNSSVQPQNKPRSHFEFVPRDTEDSRILDLLDFGCVAFSVETVIEEGLFVSWLYNPCYTPRACWIIASRWEILILCHTYYGVTSHNNTLSAPNNQPNDWVTLRQNTWKYVTQKHLYMYIYVYIYTCIYLPTSVVYLLPTSVFYSCVYCVFVVFFPWIYNPCYSVVVTIDVRFNTM